MTKIEAIYFIIFILISLKVIVTALSCKPYAVQVRRLACAMNI